MTPSIKHNHMILTRISMYRRDGFTAADIMPTIQDLMQTVSNVSSMNGNEKKQWVEEALRFIIVETIFNERTRQTYEPFITQGLQSVDVIIHAAKHASDFIPNDDQKRISGCLACLRQLILRQ